MVDQIRVSRLLRRITDALSTLEREAAAAKDRRADPMWLPGVKYTLVNAIESCVDVAQHLCSSEGWGPPANNGDAISLLARHGVLNAALATRMRQAVGFRNVLVHDYIDVDNSIVLSRLADLRDLRKFVHALTTYLNRPAS